MKVRFAVAPPGRDWVPGAYAELVDGVESKGFDTLWLSDVPLSPTVDTAVGLAFAAARTQRLKIGANVVPIGRNPMLLAKQLAQIDQLSGGRLLLMLVPGLGSDLERTLLGVRGVDRGARMDEVVGLLRRFFAGEAVKSSGGRFELPGVPISPLPIQDPLELWLGGSGPRALERAGRLSDGWLGSALTPEEAGRARTAIEKAAASAGRAIDPEHFGLSIAYARVEPPAQALAFLAERRPGADPKSMIPSGRDGLRALIGALVAEGLSKFVLRPTAAPASISEELDWLADAVLDLQT